MTRRLLHRGTVGLIALACTLLAGAASAQNVSVTAATPNTGQQGTLSLVVKINGKNFAPGAKADFFLSGTTNPAGIVVHGTQWVSATEVDATIDIADTASLAFFDVKVTNTSGRSGKGSDLFQVVQKTQQQGNDRYTLGDAVTFRNEAPGPASLGDGLLSDGNSTYTNGAQGVAVRIWTGGTGDLQLDLGTGGRKITAQTVPDRLLTSLGGPYLLNVSSWAVLQVLDIWHIPVPGPGETPTPILRTAVIGGFVASDILEYGASNNLGPGTDGSTQVWVTRWSKTAWTISTDNTPAQAGYRTQVSKRQVRITAEYALPFQVEVTCSRCATVP